MTSTATAAPATSEPTTADQDHDYFAEYDEIGTGPQARGPALLHIDVKPGAWKVRQVFDDPHGDHDYRYTPSP